MEQFLILLTMCDCIAFLSYVLQTCQDMSTVRPTRPRELVDQCPTCLNLFSDIDHQEDPQDTSLQCVPPLRHVSSSSYCCRPSYGRCHTPFNPIPTMDMSKPVHGPSSVWVPSQDVDWWVAVMFLPLTVGASAILFHLPKLHGDRSNTDALAY